MSDSWRQWEGQTVATAFPLLRYLGGSQRGAVFFTERREHGRVIPAAIKLVPSSAEKAELRLNRWKQAAGLSHPNLIRLFDSGRYELAGVPIVYVVMELADENLGQVLSERPLTPDETRVMLETVLDVVGHLHGKDLIHGHIKPSNILAIGDRLKLSSDRICRAGEPLENPGDPDEYDPPEYARGIIPVQEKTSKAADVWSLGITLIETLTSKPPEPRVAGQQQSAPETLPQPFAEIVSHCLRAPKDRWSAGKIGDCLAGRIPSRTTVPLKEPAWNADDASELSGERRGFGALTFVAIAMLLVGIVVGIGWWRQSQASIAQAPAVVTEAGPAAQQDAPPAPVSNAKSDDSAQQAPPPRAAAPSAPHSSSALNPSTAPARNAAPPVAAPKPDVPATKPAVPPLEPTRPTRANRIQEAADNGLTGGQVTRQVMPTVSQSSLSTIHGTVKVKIKVDVDPSGSVSNAEFESPGSSKYFAGVAMQAALGWKFDPAQAGGRPVASSWELQFEFARDGAKAVPMQTAP